MPTSGHSVPPPAKNNADHGFGSIRNAAGLLCGALLTGTILFGLADIIENRVSELYTYWRAEQEKKALIQKADELRRMQELQPYIRQIQQQKAMVKERPKADQAAPSVDPLFLQQLDDAGAEIEQELQAKANAERPQTTLGSIAQGVNDAVVSASVGMHKALFETKDAIVGEPVYAEKWQYRRDVEALGAHLQRKSVVNGLVRITVEFGVTFVGIGAILKTIQRVTIGTKLEKAGQLLFGQSVRGIVLRAAAATAIIFDLGDGFFSALVK